MYSLQLLFFFFFSILWLSFQSVDCLLCCAEDFLLYIVSFVYFSFHYLCFGGHIQKIFAYTYVMKIFPMFLLQFQVLTLKPLIHFELIIVYVISPVQFYFIFLWISSFPSIICWRDCPFPIVYSCIPYHRPVDLICIDLFLGSLFCSSDLYCYFEMKEWSL